MLRMALAFLVVAIIAGVLGFGGVATASVDIARILFFIFLLGFLITLVAAVIAGRKLTRP